MRKNNTETRSSFYMIPIFMIGLVAINMVRDHHRLENNISAVESPIQNSIPILELSGETKEVFYEDVAVATQAESYIVLVNKNNILKDSYSPSDLAALNVVTFNNAEISLRTRAAVMAEQLFQAANEEAGIVLLARSGYRSYQEQESTYHYYVEMQGQEAADRFSARAGHSEHQTGLALDVTADSVHGALVTEFGETDEGRWLQENAHRFGFIIRYPQGREEDTGYMYEPWHIRYVGLNTASIIYQNNWILEEYLQNQ